MTEITASLVKELRDRTNAGMMDCKKALNETSGDIEAAIDWLRKKGLANAAKKAGNITAEGLVSAYIDGNQGVILEVNSQTDFVAQNQMFQDFVKSLSKLALQVEDIDALKKLSYADGKTVEEELTNLVSTIGENLSLRRMKKVISDKKVFSYIHNASSEGMGKIAVIVAFNGEGSSEAIGKQIAMHIASTKPSALSIESLDPALVEREKEVQKAKALEEGKPAEIVEKMLAGRISKFYQEVCLLEQSFVMNPDKKVFQVLKEEGVTLVDYAYYILGEGIEKKEEDFAAEVAKVVAGK
jgi:elongation factor Ts